MAFEAAKFQVDVREGKGPDLNVQLTLSGEKSEYVDGRPLNGQYKTWTVDCGPRTADWV